MTVDGWIPVNPLTLETSLPGVFAVGDVTSVGTPKAGVFSERQAAVAAQRIISLIREAPRPPSMTATACATSSSDMKRWPVWESRFGAGNRPPAPTRHRRSCWRPRRRSSGPAVYNGGLIVPGQTYLGRLETGGIRDD